MTNKAACDIAMVQDDSGFHSARFPTHKNGTAIGTADMNGWDTIYTVRASVINSALLKHFETRTAADALHLEVKIESQIYDVEIDARFGAWQLCSGGAGNRIRLEMPLTEGSATVNGRSVSTIDLAGAMVVAEVSLGFHCPPDLAHDEPLIAQLKVVTERHAPHLASAVELRQSEQKEPASQDKVNVLDISRLVADGIPAATVDGLKSAIKAGIQEWLTKNIEIFDYVFLSVDIAEEANKGDFVWIKPTTVGFAVTDVLGAEGEAKETIFGVLSMTRGEKPEGVTPQISASSIPIDDDVNAAFLIAPHLVIEKLLQPSVHTLFHNAKPEDFGRSRDGLTLQNVKEIQLPLHLDPEQLTFAKKDVNGKITKGNFCITTQGLSIRTMFRNVTFAYGTDDELDVQLTYDASNAIGLDKESHFAMQRVGEVDSHVTVQPNQEKMSQGIYKTVAGMVVAQVACAIVFAGFGAAFSRIATSLRGAGRMMTAGSRDALLMTEEVSLLAEEEVQLAGTSSGRIGVTGLAQEVWTVARCASAGKVATLADFLSSGLSKPITVLIAGQAIGMLWGERSQIDTLSALHEHPEKMPTMADFGSMCISHITWPQTSHATLLSAGLNGAFTLGFKIES